MYKEFTGVDLPCEKVREFLSDIPHWSLYLAGWAHAIYHRAIRDANYGTRLKPGTIDLWCAVYLPSCHIFVTDDGPQRRALRLINVFNPRKTRILSYKEFRKRLLIR